MKKIYFLSVFFFSILLKNGYAQISNNQFENWTIGAYDSLNYWSTDNFLAPGCAQKEITDVQSGSASLKLVTTLYINGFPFSLPGAASTGGFSVTGFNINLAAGGQADSARHAFLRGYCHYASLGGAQGSIETVLYKYNGSSRDTVASGILSVSDTSNYFSFLVPLVYRSAGNPDSSIVYFQSSGRDAVSLFNSGTIGSALYVDSVFFDGIVGIHDLPSKLISMISYPNPASEFLTLETSWKTPVKGSVDILDLKGTLVQQLPLINGKQRIDISELSNGNYFYRLADEKGNMLGNGKFSVSK